MAGSLIKNGKYYLPPNGGGGDFKALFNRLASAGAGRRVDENGFPQGPWTPDLLADAISRIEANGSGIELRTVQLWFQDNDKGISSDNIRWLARIFGCDDPDAASAWQIELIAANKRLAAKRRGLQSAETYGAGASVFVSRGPRAAEPATPAQETTAKAPTSGFNLARRTEAMFDGRNTLNLPIVIWAGSALLAILAYAVGTHSITFSPVPGLDKQVGLLWAPSWTVDRIVFVALFLFIVSETLHSWKTEWRAKFADDGGEQSRDASWLRRMDDAAPMCWLILGACLLVVFLGQWLGVYWLVLAKGVTGNAMIDWILVAIERPDVVTVSEAVIVSGLANLYSCFVYWAFFSGLVLLHAMAGAFQYAAGSCDADRAALQVTNMFDIGGKLMGAIFCCTVFGILSASSIKLNAVYLISDGENILAWLLGDALAALGATHNEWGWLERTAWPYVTSFFVIFVTCFVFFACQARIRSGLKKVNSLAGNIEPGERSRAEGLMKQAQVSWQKMSGVVGLLTVNFALLGTFTGFSMLLLLSISVGVASCIWWAGSAETRVGEI
ncbi:RcgA family putative transporter [Mameliella alba]|nr:hypothetical protein [Mameliella alba]